MIKTVIRWLAHLIINTALVLASLGVSLCAAEWFVRVYMPCPDYGTGKRPALRNKLFMHDSLLGWKGSPNAQSRYISKDFMVTVTHDALGYRNQFPPYVPGKKNYLLLGDSYAWGWGVEDNETAAAVFNANNTDSNMYNLGVPGYGTDQELLAFKQLLDNNPTYQYDGVFIAFYYNDFENVGMSESHLYAKPAFQFDAAGQLVLTNVPVPKNTVEEVSITEEAPEIGWPGRIQLLNLLGEGLPHISAFLDHREEQTAQPAPITFSDWEKNNQTLAAALLSEMNTLSRHRNMTFHVIFLMTRNTDAIPAAMNTSLANMLKQKNIDHSFFYSRIFPRTDLWLDTHYTHYGQKFLAGHIESLIETMPE